VPPGQGEQVPALDTLYLPAGHSNAVALVDPAGQAYPAVQFPVQAGVDNPGADPYVPVKRVLGVGGWGLGAFATRDDLTNTHNARSTGPTPTTARCPALPTASYPRGTGCRSCCSTTVQEGTGCTPWGRWTLPWYPRSPRDMGCRIRRPWH
jgi:hypothetical protein